MRRVYAMVAIVFVLVPLVVLTAGAAPSTRARDVCIASPTGGGTFNTFIFRNVEPLSRGQVVAVDGLYFSTGAQRVAPVHGSAVMVPNGTVRLGFFVHATAAWSVDSRTPA